MGGAQSHGVVSAVFAAAMFFILFGPSVTLSGEVGFALALDLGLAASAGLLMFSALPAARLPRYRRAKAGGVVALTSIALLLATGLASSTEDRGSHRVLAVSGPDRIVEARFPGWLYGVPLMLAAVVPAASTYAALHRISSAPASPDPRTSVLDRRWRAISSRTAWRFGTGALLCYFGGGRTTGGGRRRAPGTGGKGGSDHPYGRPQASWGHIRINWVAP